MKQILLAMALIAAPVGIFTGGYKYLSPVNDVVAKVSLGDLGDLKTIVTDVQAIAAAGDLKKAEARITDFETAWDDAQAAMRPLNPTAWGNVDEAADVAIKSLRGASPEAATVQTALSDLVAKLDNPDGATSVSASAAILIEGVAITGPDGRPLPCEVMIKQMETSVSGAKLSPADAASVADFKTKALERCNADDDQHADEFSARAIAIATH